MAMKLSQLKREGAKEYSHSHSHDPSMPPLKSGGMFSKSLREINLKVSLHSCCCCTVRTDYESFLFLISRCCRYSKKWMRIIFMSGGSKRLG